jgi:hypothetical protein
MSHGSPAGAADGVSFPEITLLKRDVVFLQERPELLLKAHLFVKQFLALNRGDDLICL